MEDFQLWTPTPNGHVLYEPPAAPRGSDAVMDATIQEMKKRVENAEKLQIIDALMNANQYFKNENKGKKSQE